MRYMLLLHIREREIQTRAPEWVEEVVSFLAQFDDELASQSELEWTETLGDEKLAEVVGPGEERRPGWFNDAGSPIGRLWVVRVESPDRVRELAAWLAGELDTWIEVRECLPSAQRP